MNTSLQNLLTVVFLFLMGNLLATGAIAIMAISQGLTLDQLSQMGTDPSSLPESLIGGMLWIQSICVFIIPAVAYWLIKRQKGFAETYHLNQFPGIAILGIATFVLVSGYPLVHASFVVNSLIPLPDWATNMEDSAADILGSVLAMDSFGDYLVTLCVVAVLPAIGEELIFRGIVQPESGRLVGNQVAGIWIAAFLFSLIHFQFEGFLPRFFLGAILGYLYYFTKTMWVPIIAHFLNNGFQVTALYVTGVDMTASSEDDLSITWWVLAISVIAFASLMRLLKRQAQPEWTDRT